MLGTPLSARPVTMNHVEIKSESKEDFFAIKRNLKRMKASNTFLDNQQTNLPDHSKQASILLRPSQQPFGKVKQEELASTFGSDSVLSFKSRQPRRKKNRKPRHGHQQLAADQSQSDNQAPLHSHIQQSYRDKIHEQRILESKGSRFTIQSFMILGQIGEGTYSKVFRAMELRTGFVCALKVLEKEKLRLLKVQQNVNREIKINLFLSHLNIAKLYGFFDDYKAIYLICQLSTETNLYDTLNKTRNQYKHGMPIERVANFVRQICESVRFMHENCLLHRDIKPENILLTCTNTVKLCDFGWSVYNPDKSLRSTFCGTPLYLAPQLVSQSTYDQSVDVWAIGVLTYQLLTRQIPFKIKSIRDLSKVLNSDIKFDKIQDKNAQDFINCALQKDKNNRKNIQQLCQHKFLTQNIENEGFS